MSKRTTRRTFIKYIGAAGAGLPLVMPRLARAQPANSTLHVALIGTGGKGGVHIQAVRDFRHNCVCYADVDKRMWKEAAEAWPDAAAYQDYRRMYDREHPKIDAVFVTTPDHHHYLASMLALQHDIHCFTQKPLTWSVWEARKLAEEAARRKVATQMGNQGHAGEGWRLVVEWVRAGLIGDVTEVHTWTNRPIWPQGQTRPEGSDPVPPELDWDVWIGPAPMRPYSEKGDPDNRFSKYPYHPFSWRGWFDFGAGALGDMACHTMDGFFWALDPGAPETVEAVFVKDLTEEAFPNASTIKWTFPARNGRPALTHYWYDGSVGETPNKPQTPEDLQAAGRDLPRTGNLFIGSKGKIIVAGDYGNSPRPFPDDLVAEAQRTPKTLERPPEPAEFGYERTADGRRALGHFEDKHHLEFFLAASGQKPLDYPKSNFAYAGPMTETIQLGNVALRAGERIYWDSENLKVTNVTRANEFIHRQPRQGWDISRSV